MENEAENTQKRDQQPKDHVAGFAGSAVSPNAMLFGLLWPGANSSAISAALGGRISAAHVRMYRRGARPLPDWLRELAHDRMRAIGETLEAAPKGNGRKAGLRNLWRGGPAARRAARNLQR